MSLSGAGFTPGRGLEWSPMAAATQKGLIKGSFPSFPPLDKKILLPAGRRICYGCSASQRYLKEVTFSLFTKAFMASFWSSVAKHRPKASLS